jgi:hypothetical protein
VFGGGLAGRLQSPVTARRQEVRQFVSQHSSQSALVIGTTAQHDDQEGNDGEVDRPETAIGGPGISGRSS